MLATILKQHCMSVGAEADVTIGGDRFEVGVEDTDRSEAYVRQGEWFFVPCPEFDSDRHIVAHNGTLVRYQAKRHHVEMLCRPPDGETYVRGKVWHPDHRTIYLDGWHKVRRNTEVVPSDFVVEREAEQRDALFQVNFVD